MRRINPITAACALSLAGAVLPPLVFAQIDVADMGVRQPAVDLPDQASPPAFDEASVLLFLATQARAQEGAAPGAPPPLQPTLPVMPGVPAVPAMPSLPFGVMPSGSTVRVVIGGSGSLASIAGADAFMGTRVVEGAPYCADAISEYLRPLPDGNRISKRSSTRLCRDAQGRTRQEVGTGEARRVFINDPVAKTTWVLNPNSKTFSRMVVSLNGEGGTVGGSVGGSVGGANPEVVRNISSFSGNANGIANTNGGTTRVQFSTQVQEQPSMSADARQRLLDWARDFSDRMRGGKNVAEINVTQIAGPASLRAELSGIGSVSGIGGVSGLSGISALDRGTAAVSALGPRDIDGVRAEGQLTTWTIEAGKVGNEKPIRITREVWTSPELMLTVLSKDNDPRDGENNYRLTNVVRSAPDPELFKVPSEFSERKR